MKEDMRYGRVMGDDGGGRGGRGEDIAVLEG